MESSIVRLGSFLVFSVALAVSELEDLTNFGAPGAEIHVVYLSTAYFGVVVWPQDGRTLNEVILEVAGSIWGYLQRNSHVDADLEMPEVVQGDPSLLFLGSRTELQVDYFGVVYAGDRSVGWVPVGPRASGSGSDPHLM